MPRPDEGLIHAWLDGELSPEESERVARLVADDAEWGAAAAEARGLIAASSRILTALDAVPAGVIPKGTRAAKGPAATGTPRFTVRPWMKLAAGFALVAGTTVVLTRDAASPAMQSEAVVMAVEPSVPAQDAARATAAASTVDSAPAATRPAPVPARRDVANAATTQRFSDVAVTGISTAQKSEPAPPRAPAETNQALPQGATLGAAGAAAAPPPAVVGELADAATRERAAQDRAAIDRAAQERAATERAGIARAELDRAAPPRVAEPRAAELRSRASVSARAEGAVAAKALSVRALEGCWRTTTPTGADTVLVTPTILRTVGDSLVIAAGSEVRPATIVQDGDVLRGETTDATGAKVPFRATRASCPARPDERELPAGR